MNEKNERPDVKPATTNTLTKQELLDRWVQGTNLTLIHSSTEGHCVKRRNVALVDENRIVLAQADGKKGHSEPAEIVFQDGDTITEEVGKQVTITIASPDGKSVTYAEGYMA